MNRRSADEHAVEMTIGDFASMTRLTVRALRHYDQIGLLHPARVDPTNGYRYYDSGQIVSASTIAVLRSLDIDVDTIGRLLDGSTGLNDIVEAEQARRAAEARRAAASLAVLEALPTLVATTADDPEIEEVADRVVIGTTLTVGAGDDIEPTARAFDQLIATLDDADLAHDPDDICVIRRSTREEMRLDLGMVIATSDLADRGLADSGGAEADRSVRSAHHTSERLPPVHDRGRTGRCNHPHRTACVASSRPCPRAALAVRPGVCASGRPTRDLSRRPR